MFNDPVKNYGFYAGLLVGLLIGNLLGRDFWMFFLIYGGYAVYFLYKNRGL